MSFKVIIFAAALFASQANAQIGGVVRPFITGYANGLTEFTKPFMQLGQNIMAPGSDYFPSVRPQIGQWMIFPNGRPVVPQPPSIQGYETLSSTLPNGASVVQIIRPQPFNPQMVPAFNPTSLLRPFRPFPNPLPAPAPANEESQESEESEESEETYIPSNLLPEEIPEDLPADIQTGADVPVTLDLKDVPALQRPSPFEEDKQ